MNLAHESMMVLTRFIESCLREDESNNLTLHDPTLNDYASDCTTIQISSFLAEMNRIGLAETGLVQSRRLLGEVLSRSDSNDWFGIPYNALPGAGRNIDLAEFGASAGSAAYLAKNVDSVLGAALLRAMANRVQSFEANERIGAHYKNLSAESFDVLNGDLYAALVLGEAYQVTGESTYHHKMVATIRHLIDRFDFEKSQWPYSEFWDGSVSIGMSVAYQATISGWGRRLLPILGSDLRAQFRSVLESAELEVLDQIGNGRSLENESTTWVSQWERVWEIWQSLFWCQNSSVASDWIVNRILEVDRGIASVGIEFMHDPREARPHRTILGSKLRSVGNMVAVQQSALSFQGFLAPVW